MSASPLLADTPSSRCHSPCLCSQTATYCLYTMFRLTLMLPQTEDRTLVQDRVQRKPLCHKVWILNDLMQIQEMFTQAKVAWKCSASDNNNLTKYSSYLSLLISHTFQNFPPNQTISTGWPLLLCEWEGRAENITPQFHQCRAETQMQFGDILTHAAMELE